MDIFLFLKPLSPHPSSLVPKEYKYYRSRHIEKDDTSISGYSLSARLRS